MPIKFSVFIDKIHGQSDTAGMQANAPNAAGAPVLLPSAHSPLCWYDGHGCHDKGCLETGGGGVCQVSKYLNCCKSFPLPHNRKNTAYLENTSFSRWTFQLWSELDNDSAEDFMSLRPIVNSPLGQFAFESIHPLLDNSPFWQFALLSIRPQADNSLFSQSALSSIRLYIKQNKNSYWRKK